MHHNLAFLKSTPYTLPPRNQKNRNRVDFSFCFKAWTHPCLFLTENSCGSFHNDLFQSEVKAELAWCFWCFGQRTSRWPEGSTKRQKQLFLYGWSVKIKLITRFSTSHPEANCNPQVLTMCQNLMIPCKNIKYIIKDEDFRKRMIMGSCHMHWA